MKRWRRSRRWFGGACRGKERYGRAVVISDALLGSIWEKKGQLPATGEVFDALS